MNYYYYLKLILNNMLNKRNNSYSIAKTLKKNKY